MESKSTINSASIFSEKSDFINYLLHLADNSLILSHRNSEWCGHGPVLEQDIAITNISLDLLGQARLLYQYAAEILNKEENTSYWNEDRLAYLRNEREYKNIVLVELPKGDWATTILKQFLFSAFQILQFDQLQKSADKQLAAIAIKSLKEIKYHLRWSSEWVVRLGDGTTESHQRMIIALNEINRYTVELFKPATYETSTFKNKTGTDVTLLKENWNATVKHVLEEATLESLFPFKDHWTGFDGKNGIHTEHFGYLLTELQYMQRAFPDSEW